MRNGNEGGESLSDTVKIANCHALRTYLDSKNECACVSFRRFLELFAPPKSSRPSYGQQTRSRTSKHGYHDSQFEAETCSALRRFFSDKDTLTPVYIDTTSNSNLSYPRLPFWNRTVFGRGLTGLTGTMSKDGSCLHHMSLKSTDYRSLS